MVQIGQTNTTGPADSTESNGQRILVSNWFLAGIPALFVALRIYCKFLRRKGLWWDDWILIVSWILLVADVIVTTVNISYGFGDHIYAIPHQNLETIGMLGALASFLTILSEAWSKTSFAVTLLRLTSGHTKNFVWFCIMSLNLLMAVSAIMQWTQCIPIRRAWNPTVEGKCLSLKYVTGQGITFAAYSGVVDITLALLPWKILWGLKMKPKEKIGVGLAMSMGIMAGITALIKCSMIPTLNRKDFTYHGADLVIWSNVEITTTIIAASIPVLRVLFVEVSHGSSASRFAEKISFASWGVRRSTAGSGKQASTLVDTEPRSQKTQTIGSVADVEASIATTGYESQHRQGEGNASPSVLFDNSSDDERAVPDRAHLPSHG